MFCVLLCFSASCHSVRLHGFLLLTSQRFPLDGLKVLARRTQSRAMGSVKPGPAVTWFDVFFCRILPRIW